MARLLEATARKWASSECDPYPCGLSVWQYACAASGVEAPPLPDHRNRRAMVELLRSRGGLEQYARERMASIGWQEVRDPVRGDVGIVDIPGMGPTCAICLGSKWMARGPRLVLTIAAPLVAAWSRSPCLKPSLP